MKRLVVLMLFVFTILFAGTTFSADHKVTFSEKGIMSNDDETPDIDLNTLYFDFNVPDNLKFLAGKVYYGEFTHPLHSMEPYPGIKGAKMYLLFTREIAGTIHFYASVAQRSYRKTFAVRCTLDEMKCERGGSFFWKLIFTGDKFELRTSDGWSAIFEQVATLPALKRE